MSSEKKTAIIYAHYHRNNEAKYNLLWFLGNLPDDADCYIIVNLDQGHDPNTILADIENKDKLEIIFRENTGYDFGAYCTGIKHIKDAGKHYDYYFFKNTSAFGPVYSSNNWLDPFQKLLQEKDVKLVGPTINICTWPVVTQGAPCKSHVQTYCFMMDHECLEYIWSKGIFQQQYLNLIDVVLNQEVTLSTAVLANGWNISCMVKEYQGKDYRTLKRDINPSSVNGDILFPGNRCFYRDVTTQELIFTKSNRGLHRIIYSRQSSSSVSSS